MADEDPPPKSDPELSDLRRRVEAARQEDRDSAPPPNAASLAVRFGGEFGAAIVVGALLGYGVDRLILHGGSWGLLIGLGLGFVTGVVNVVRTAQSYNRANPPDPNARSIPDDED